MECVLGANPQIIYLVVKIKSDMRCFLCRRVHWIFLVTWIQAAGILATDEDPPPVRTRLPWPSKPALEKDFFKNILPGRDNVQPIARGYVPSKDVLESDEDPPPVRTRLPWPSKPALEKDFFKNILPKRDNVQPIARGYVAAFDRNIARNVTTQRGQTGYLHCVVNNVEDKTVSWIRRRDFHVLTVGLDIYTSENRFESSHVASTNDWVLKINYVQVHDSGVYECQVSSDPKISFFVNLNVVVAVANILSSPDLFVRRGSSINLTCIISQSPEPPLFVFWYHNRRMINYDVSKAEINVQKSTSSEDTTVSRLFIRSAETEDAGNYTCCPSNAEATSIQVHVVLDEKQEAIQHDSGHTSSRGVKNYSGLLCVLLTWIHDLTSKRPI